MQTRTHLTTDEIRDLVERLAEFINKKNPDKTNIPDNDAATLGFLEAIQETLVPQTQYIIWNDQQLVRVWEKLSYGLKKNNSYAGWLQLYSRSEEFDVKQGVLELKNLILSQVYPVSELTLDSASKTRTDSSSDSSDRSSFYSTISANSDSDPNLNSITELNGDSEADEPPEATPVAEEMLEDNDPVVDSVSYTKTRKKARRVPISQEDDSFVGSPSHPTVSTSSDSVPNLNSITELNGDSEADESPEATPVAEEMLEDNDPVVDSVSYTKTRKKARRVPISQEDDISDHTSSHLLGDVSLDSEVNLDSDPNLSLLQLDVDLEEEELCEATLLLTSNPSIDSSPSYVAAVSQNSVDVSSNPSAEIFRRAELSSINHDMKNHTEHYIEVDFQQMLNEQYFDLSSEPSAEPLSEAVHQATHYCYQEESKEVYFPQGRLSDNIHRDDLAGEEEALIIVNSNAFLAVIKKSVLNVIDNYITNHSGSYGKKRAEQLKQKIESASSEANLTEEVRQFIENGKTAIDTNFCSFFSSLSRSSNTSGTSLRGMLMDKFIYEKNSTLPRNKRVDAILSSLKNGTFKDKFELLFTEDKAPAIAESYDVDARTMMRTRLIY